LPDRGLGVSARTDDFVVRQNVAHFRNELEHGATDSKRAILLKLLVAQEDLLGRTSELHSDITTYIVKVKQTIQKQLETIALLKAHGQPMDQAEKKLCELLDLLIVHEQHRSKIEAVIWSE
jgi:hypothetical protein